MKWVKASERLPVFSHRTISRFIHTQTPLFDVQEFLLKNPHRANRVEWLDESQPSGGKSAEFEHKERLDILEKHFGSDFYKTGQWHNAISDAMEEYAQQYANQQPVNDGWVRVEDGLPDVGDYVLVYNTEGAILVGRLLNNGWGALFSDGEKLMLELEATHWRPLPEPPKQTV